MTKAPASVRGYLAATHLMPFVAPSLLRRRLKREKEHPTRWAEKLGKPSQDRPTGKLIWLHAVGLGEVLSLRGLITSLATKTDAHFLVTSSTRTSAAVFAKNLPPRTIHQFLPLDAPPYRKAFLDHWQPDLCIWAEQDIWPGLVHAIAKRNIPQGIVAARMNDTSRQGRSKAAALHRWLYDQMAFITAQDDKTRDNLTALGAKNVTVTGSLKPTAPPLEYDPSEHEKLQAALNDRFVWITAPSHPADEEIALAAHKRVLNTHPKALFIIAPRFPNRTITPEMPTAIRSKGQIPGPNHAVYLADTFGDLGLLYRCAKAAFIGGTNDMTQGHSPWEAAILGTAICHGPQTANFQSDYAMLHQADAATRIETADALAAALVQNQTQHIANATALIKTQHATVDALAEDLVRVL